VDFNKKMQKIQKFKQKMYFRNFSLKKQLIFSLTEYHSKKCVSFKL